MACEESCHMGWEIWLQVALKVVYMKPPFALGIERAMHMEPSRRWVGELQLQSRPVCVMVQRAFQHMHACMLSSSETSVEGAG